MDEFSCVGVNQNVLHVTITKTNYVPHWKKKEKKRRFPKRERGGRKE